MLMCGAVCTSGLRNAEWHLLSSVGDRAVHGGEVAFWQRHRHALHTFLHEPPLHAALLICVCNESLVSVLNARSNPGSDPNTCCLQSSAKPTAKFEGS